MFRRLARATNMGHGFRLWPVFVLLTAVVALPTAGVFWFMNQAMQNEHLAVRQRLTEVYRSRILSASERVQAAWLEKVSNLTQYGKQEPKSEAFADIVKSGYANSALLYDNARVAYPELSVWSSMSREPGTKLWLEARRQEYENDDPQRAAALYKEIAEQAAQDWVTALALVSQARCMNKAGRSGEAIELLISKLGAGRFRYTADAQGRLIQLNGLLFALELMDSPQNPRFPEAARSLFEHLNNYGAPAMPASQRRFLMQQLQSIWPDCPPFPTQAAEEIAAEFVKIEQDPLKPGQLQATPLKDIWAYQIPDKSLIALFDKEHLLTFMNEALAAEDSIPGIYFTVLMPNVSEPAFMTEKIGEAFPSWHLALNPEGPDPFESASSQKITIYFWTGILMIGGIVLLSLLLAGFLRRQIRLTRLKNDLIANVSHELKTPLASTRLLVDTLRDGRYQDTALVQEYLQMISRENSRLSNLIEEFLTFSRMERNKTKFDRNPLKTEEIIHTALEAMGERLQAPNCHFHLDLAEGLPGLTGDRDALVTVLVNLLDNALKYSGDDKEIQLRGFASNGNVVLEVQDNGMGFPRSAAKKIFDRFYQVDRTLSRQTGGCGLGLSIVRFIVTSHNGSIVAKSQPGRGSTFTVQLPAS